MPETENKLICITGVDGAGKSSLTEWLVQHLKERGMNTASIWSRFNNYLSKPMLAVTRITGHNYYQNLNGVRYGFHDFENLPVYRELFAILQSVDVNIAAYFKITRKRTRYDVLVCERSPWDTLVDVISDTGLDDFVYNRLSRIYLGQVRGKSLTLFIDRDHDKILKMRPELEHDHTMERKIGLYRRFADSERWCTIDNNSTLDESREQIRAAVDGYLKS